MHRRAYRPPVARLPTPSLLHWPVVARRLADFRLRLALVAVAGLAVRVAWVLGYGRTQEVAGDQVFYHYQALALAHGDGFVNPYAWADPAQRLLIPTAAHPPLYSLYLAVWSWLGMESHLQHRLVSALLGTACVVVVGLVGRRLGGDRAGLVAAVFAALYPNLWINDGVLAAESAYALCVALVLLAAYRLWDSGRVGDALWLGAAIGAATLARAEGALLVVLVALPLVWFLRGPDRREKVRLLAAVGGAALVLVGPWVVRNLTTWDEPVLLSTGAGFVIEISNCDASYAGRFLGYWSPECERPDTWPIQPELRPGMSQAEIDAAWQDARVASARIEPVVEQRKREAGLTYVREHLDRFPVVVAARVGRIWDLWRPAQSVEFNDFFERRGRLPSAAGMLVYYPLLALSGYGLVVLRRRRVTLVPAIGVALSVTAAAASSFGITRYRVGADVVLCVLAGVAVAALWPERAVAPAAGAESSTPVPSGEPATATAGPRP